jgi:hypothetical protein
MAASTRHCCFSMPALSQRHLRDYTSHRQRQDALNHLLPMAWLDLVLCNRPRANCKLHVEKINPNADEFNRPENLIVPKDDYMGKRPYVDAVANPTRLVEECGGTCKNNEKMLYVYDRLKYLEHAETEHFYTPWQGESVSEHPPELAEYLNSDGHNNTLSEYPSYMSASKQSVGQCNGPIVPYHVCWAEPATWWVELFIKSHLYTQNVPCVRLWL